MLTIAQYHFPMFIPGFCSSALVTVQYAYPARIEDITEDDGELYAYVLVDKDATQKVGRSLLFVEAGDDINVDSDRINRLRHITTLRYQGRKTLHVYEVMPEQ